MSRATGLSALSVEVLQKKMRRESSAALIHMVFVYHVGMDQYLLIPFLGDEHPFTSYFDVHQGYKVLTHCHVIQ